MSVPRSLFEPESGADCPMTIAPAGAPCASAAAGAASAAAASTASSLRRWFMVVYPPRSGRFRPLGRCVIRAIGARGNCPVIEALAPQDELLHELVRGRGPEAEALRDDDEAVGAVRPATPCRTRG